MVADLLKSAECSYLKEPNNILLGFYAFSEKAVSAGICLPGNRGDAHVSDFYRSRKKSLDL
jgi:hypothetical protein